MSTATPLPRRQFRGVSHADRIGERRARLIEAGIALFGTVGYHGSTIKAICAEARLTERYFYESFANSEQLLQAAYEQATQMMRETVTAATLAAGADPGPRVRAGLDCFFGIVRANPALARLVLVELEGVSDTLNAVYRAEMQTWARLIPQLIGPALPAQPANGLSAELLTAGVVGAIYQLAKDWMLARCDLPQQQLVDNSYAIYMAIIGRWAGTPLPPARTARA